MAGFELDTALLALWCWLGYHSKEANLAVCLNGHVTKATCIRCGTTIWEK